MIRRERHEVRCIAPTPLAMLVWAGMTCLLGVRLAILPSAMASDEAARPAPPTSLVLPGEERYLGKVRALTSGGQNAEAYFSFDGTRLVFQSTRDGYPCDQIYLMKPDGSGVQRISNGTGRTTCAFIYPGGKDVLFASTHEAGKDCPPPPDRSMGYVWALYDYDLFRTRLGSGVFQRLTSHRGYDAEGVLTPDGKTIVFTSLRDGDLDIYSMTEGNDAPRRLTNAYGFDGGPFVSWDGRKIVYRGYHPDQKEDIEAYRSLIAKNLMKPARAEIYVMNLDGSENRQLTTNGAANWAPAFHPGGNKIIFSSNMAAPGTRNFDLYLMNPDGTGIERVTQGSFNSFPYFSPDGKTLVFCSDRGAKEPHEFNVFAADWIAAAGSPPSRP